jgi:uncharacterized protein (TIGR02246 family)
MPEDQTYRESALQVLNALGDAIAAGDAESVLALFNASDDVVMFGSERQEVAYGYQDLERLWRRVLARGQTYVWRWKNETVIGGPDLAVVSAEALVEITTSDGVRTVPYRATVVVRKTEGKWRICQYHGSEPADAW